MNVYLFINTLTYIYIYIYIYIFVYSIANMVGIIISITIIIIFYIGIKYNNTRKSALLNNYQLRLFVIYSN